MSRNMSIHVDADILADTTPGITHSRRGLPTRSNMVIIKCFNANIQLPKRDEISTHQNSLKIRALNVQ